MNREVRVYKGDRAADTYLFVAVDEDLERVPAELSQRMGELTQVLELKLDDQRQLVRTSGKKVLQAIESTGYYLQLPPPPISQVNVSGSKPGHTEQQ